MVRFIKLTHFIADKLTHYELKVFQQYNIRSKEDFLKAGWIKIFYGIGEEDLIELSGADFALYLKFLKSQAIMFLVLSIINCAILIPIYYKGYPQPNEIVLDFSKTSIINILGTPSRVWVAFAFVFINSIAAYIIVY